jgi:hypothetical protein
LARLGATAKKHNMLCRAHTLDTTGSGVNAPGDFFSAGISASYQHALDNLKNHCHTSVTPGTAGLKCALPPIRLIANALQQLFQEEVNYGFDAL